jgi:glucan biosynthesis protein C
MGGGSTSQNPVKKRLFYLDNLKVFLIILVVFHHAAQPYGPGGEWAVPREANLPFLNIILIGLFLGVTAAFFMGLFFLVSAYFMPGSYDRKGAGTFMKDRLVRLGIPTLIVILVVLPILSYFLQDNPNLSLFGFLGVYYSRYFEFGYTWFLASLLLFASVYVAYRLLSSPSAALHTTDIRFPGNHGIVLFILAFAAALFITRIGFPIGEWELCHLMEPARYIGYAILFIVGILAYRNNWFEEITIPLAKPWAAVLGVSIAVLPVLYLIFGDTITLGGLTIQNALFSLWDAFVCISACICLIALFRHRFNSTGNLARMLADNVYGVYLIHVPVLILMQTMLVTVALHPLLKFIMVGAVAVPLCFALSEYAVRKLPYARYVI